MSNGYKLKKHIWESGYPIGSPLYKKHPAHVYPLTNKYYLECHKFATQQEIKKFGLHHFHQLGGLIPSHPDELLGDNTRRGKIYVSMVVPENPHWKREEVRYHEEQEAICIKKKIEAFFKKHSK